jgi:hypothetical protein
MLGSFSASSLFARAPPARPLAGPRFLASCRDAPPWPRRSQAPLPDPGQWVFLSLDQRLPAAVTAVLRAPLLGLHHFLMLFLMLAFSALFNGTPRPGLQIGAQVIRWT